MRGTLKGIEVERWGGEQAHRWVGSLKPLQGLHVSEKELSRPASALVFFLFAYKGKHRLGNHLNLASEGLFTLMQRAEEVRGFCAPDATVPGSRFNRSALIRVCPVPQGAT